LEKEKPAGTFGARKGCLDRDKKVGLPVLLAPGNVNLPNKT
jgi:hypothetical protein